MRCCQCGRGTDEVLSVWLRYTGGAVSVGEVHMTCCQCGRGTVEVLSVWVRST